MDDAVDAWGVAIHNGAHLAQVLVGWNADTIEDVCEAIKKQRPQGAEDYTVSPVRISVITNPDSGSIFGGELLESVEIVAIPLSELLGDE